MIPEKSKFQGAIWTEIEITKNDFEEESISEMNKSTHAMRCEEDEDVEMLFWYHIKVGKPEIENWISLNLTELQEWILNSHIHDQM